MLRAWTFGLGRRLVLLFGTILTIFALSTLFLNQNAQSKMLEARLIARQDALSQLLTEITSSYLYDFRVAELEIILENLYAQEDILILNVIDPDGLVIADGDINSGSFLIPTKNPLIEQAIESRQMVERRSEQQIAAAYPVFLGEQFMGVVHLEVSLKQYNLDLWQLRMLNLSIGLSFMLVGIITSMAVAGRLTRPLDHLIDVTNAASKGDLDQRIDIKTNDEIETLARAFNRMLIALRSSVKEVNQLAYHDKLTGLANRAWFMEYLDAVADQVGDGKSSAAVLFLDLDRFKQVNDTLGHDIGDDLLIAFSERLIGTVDALGWGSLRLAEKNPNMHRSSDNEIVVARLGGDEFTIVLHGQDAPEVSQHLAQRITVALADAIRIGSQEISTSSSIGISYMPEHAALSREIMKKSDMAMYQAKQAGRGVFRVFDAEMAAKAEDRIKLEAELRTALAEGQFQVFFQPQFEVATERLLGAEALIRWQHPTRGLIAPLDFLPVADTAGLLPQIGRYMLTRAIAHAEQWPDRAAQPLRLAINMVVEELADRANLDYILDELQRSEFDTSRLEIEVTESTAMEDDADLSQAFHLLKFAEIRLAVDDFGVGYSNIARLKALAFQTLKIDKSLMNGVGFDPSAEALVSSLLQMARLLELQVVAEGVENRDQLAFLRTHGCDYAQGFSLARPMHADAFEAFAHKSLTSEGKGASGTQRLA